MNWSNTDCAPPLTLEGLDEVRKVLKEEAGRAIERMPVAIEAGPDILAKFNALPRSEMVSPFCGLPVFARPVDGWRFLYKEDLERPSLIMPIASKETP